MDLTSPQTVRELLSKHKAFASKGLGQHFLIDKGVLRDIIEAADLQLKDIVLEIGPGIGTLTQELAQRAQRAIIVEKDENMVEILRETLAEFKNVEILTGDILKIPDTKYLIQDTKYKLVANLPYYITSPVIRKFLETTEARPQSMVLMVQKEVAQRICSKPPEMSLLAVSVQFYAKIETIRYVSKNSFWPQPKVDSAIIKITPFIQQKSTSVPLFFKIVRTGFSHPRKQLINNFSTGFSTGRQQVEQWLINNGIKPEQRAETLSIEDWINLTKSFKLDK